MLIVEIKVWPGGNRERESLVGELHIENVGGNREVADYKVRLFGSQDPGAKGAEIKGYRRSRGAVQLVRMACAALAPPERGAAAVEQVVAAVADYFTTSTDAIYSNARRESLPRSVAMYLARERLGMSFPQIGAAFRRHHTTALSAYQRTKERLGTGLAAHVAAIVKQLEEA